MIRTDQSLPDRLEGAVRRVMLNKYSRGLQIPEEIRQAWQQPKFTRTQLRGFLEYCYRTDIDAWMCFIDRARGKRRSPWSEHSAASNALIEELQRWQQRPHDWGVQPTDAEMLRLSREALARTIRPIAAEKGK